MFNLTPKLINNINVFSFKDLTAAKVKNFYKDDPFPNYEISDDKASIVLKGDKNLYTKNLKKFIGHGKKILEIGAGTCQLSNYLAIGNNNSITAFDLNLKDTSVTLLFPVLSPPCFLVLLFEIFFTSLRLLVISITSLSFSAKQSSILSL